MSAFNSKTCNDTNCDKEFDRDPALEVECPQCGAEPGKLCERPSGHTVWAKNLPKGIHASRDVAALDAGVYGECPLNQCPESVEELEHKSSEPSAQADIHAF